MTIPVHQLIRSKRKTIALIVKPDGSLVVRAPLRTSKAVIEEFVKKKYILDRKKTGRSACCSR